MRKLLGKLGAIPGPFLRATMILLLTFPAICHAVDCDLPGFENQASITSVTPSTWFAGKTYNNVVSRELASLRLTRQPRSVLRRRSASPPRMEARFRYPA